jgi:hypothetical protein
VEQDHHGGTEVERLPVAGLLVGPVAPVVVVHPNVDAQPAGDVDSAVRGGVVDQ